MYFHFYAYEIHYLKKNQVEVIYYLFTYYFYLKQIDEHFVTLQCSKYIKI